MAVLSKRAWWFWPAIVSVTSWFFWVFLRGRGNRVIWFLALVAALGVFFYAVNAHEKKVALLQKEHDKELMKQMLLDIQSGQSVSFSSSVVQSVGLSVIILPVAVVLIFAGTLGSIFLALFLLVVSVYLILEVLMTIGRPALLVEKRGITPYQGCFVEWTRVSGMYLEVMRSRGTVVGHRLVFRVDALLDLVPRMNLPARIFYKLYSRGAVGKQIRVELRRSNESPELVRDLCLAVWGSVTGRKNFWHPGMSESLHAAFSSWEKWNVTAPDFEDSDARKWAEEALRRSSNVDAEFKKEMDRLQHWTNGGKIPTWVAVLVIVLVLLALLLPVLKNIMR